MITILQAIPDDHTPTIYTLFGEYLRWVCSEIYRLYDITFDAEAILAHDMMALDIFMPPAGRLLLAYHEDALAGCACMRANTPQIVELKRMYVRPAARRKGVGRALMEATIQEAHSGGYATLRLDSARFMSDAHALYRSAGFHEIPPYPESEIPAEFHPYWVFMELPLLQAAQG
jgi:GNAT superfamily N-acetyltransferase